MSSSVKNFGARCAAYVKWHYTDVTLRRTEKQIQREQKLLGLIPFNRWYLVCSLHPSAAMRTLAVPINLGRSVL